MIGSLVQFEVNGARGLAGLDGVGQAFRLFSAKSVRELTTQALGSGQSLMSLASACVGPFHRHCSDGIATQEGDVFEIDADAFHLPFRNPPARASSDSFSGVRTL